MIKFNSVEVVESNILKYLLKILIFFSSFCIVYANTENVIIWYNTVNNSTTNCKFGTVNLKSVKQVNAMVWTLISLKLFDPFYFPYYYK